MTIQRVRIPEGYEDLLGTTALIHVATLGPDGEPQSNPVWFEPYGAPPRSPTVFVSRQRVSTVRNADRGSHEERDSGSQLAEAKTS